jgi:hypothetical protein
MKDIDEEYQRQDSNELSKEQNLIQKCGRSLSKKLSRIIFVLILKRDTTEI